MGFLVVQDSFVTDTASYADVVLPAAVAAEDEGTYTIPKGSSAGPAAVDAHGEAYRIGRLCSGCEHSWGRLAYSEPSDVMREITEVVPFYRGMRYERIEPEGLQCHARTRNSLMCLVLHSLFQWFPEREGDLFNGRKGASCVCRQRRRRLCIDNRSVREHHGTGVRTRRSAGVTSLARAHVSR